MPSNWYAERTSSKNAEMEWWGGGGGRGGGNNDGTPTMRVLGKIYVNAHFAG